MALLSSDADEATRQLARLDGEALAIVSAITAQHRLGPLLHHLHAANGRVPEPLAESWRAAYRASAIAAMACRAELDRTCSVLEAAGMRPIALKGAWLAWQAYPDPALRPMRDIDLLLAPHEVAAAQDLLVAQGYVADPAELSLEDMLRLDKHLPGLTSPRGVRVELHHRLWEVDGRMDHRAPRDIAGDDPVVRTMRVGELRFLAPQDTLAHLIIHAVYDHRLDCGPLLFADIAWLLHASPIDWAEFWHRAEQEGWQRGARLVLELACRQAPELPVWFPPEQPPAPRDLLAAAPDLLLQDLETRKSAGVVATARSRGLAGLWRRLTARRAGADHDDAVARDLATEGGFLGWARSRLLRSTRQLSNRDVRRQASNLASLSRWLDLT
ncbi:nucleotidyltransferase family protein [Novosphingobium sp. TH158]|uniref:nucleotidyltransferase domain-containing protein n=1 Tax=Novosphingobium sp. TH158 TaxID=2067455 RepID=UPI000C7BEB4C|nr:nucleotidyltransferase family protein [Novosphingobium sp. TH158]PLK27382.1 hypothetical protein C0V78_11160 [Novosphingobium sp. TH158]